MKKFLLLTLACIAVTQTVSACPVCTSPTAVQVRNYLFGPELPFNVFALVLPFIIFTAVGAGIYYFDLPFKPEKSI